MGLPELYVQTFGEFSLRSDTATITENDIRSRKTWLLLAFLLVNRNHAISREELLSFLWSDEEKSVNPDSAMKTMLHRLRTMLDRLWEGAGHELIILRDGCYGWNNAIRAELDFEQFDLLSSAAASKKDETEQLKTEQQALRLFKGDFLPKLSKEKWVFPLAESYRSRYLQLTLSAADSLLDRSRLEEAAEICTAALRVDPFNELLYERYFSALLPLNERQLIIENYEKLRDLLFSNFGTLPGKTLHGFYREALQQIGTNALLFDDLDDLLQEQNQKRGAMVCDLDYFKTICHVQTRFMKRSGDVAHVALLTVSGIGGASLHERTLTHIMDNLREEIRLNLRCGDIAAPCSSSQFLVLLPQANYENSSLVCDRLIKSFVRHYPHSPGEISYRIHPLSKDL